QLIWYGIESGSQKILNNLGKGTTLEQSKKAVGLTDKIGIKSAGYFMFGNPEETAEDIEKTIRFSKNLPLYYAHFLKLTPRPGSKMYKEVTDTLGYDHYKKLIEGNSEVRELPRPWTNLTNEELDRYIIKAFKEFYLNPGRIIRTLSNIGTYKELKRQLKLGLKLLQIS
ncbi:MAG: hypothetical protein ABEK36_05005, partial [Candidatus Aenigmatarchaeota archaeon]